MRVALLLSCLAFTVSLQADEKLKGIACRSVHLGYTAEAGTAFYNEVTVKQSAEGTYFCAIGFNSGYFGIQEQSKGKKVVIFSVWDPTAGDDPKKVPEEKKVNNLHKDEGVRVGRFGGEGTGGQSFFDYDWKVGETYRFLVTATPDPETKERVQFAGYFYLPEKKTWKHLVTFSTVTEKKQLGGYYSFVEDFKRNKVSATITREAEYGNAWVKTAKSGWKPVSEARFTGDSNPVVNIDSGPSKTDGKFFLKTGGEIENTTVKLKEKMSEPKSTKRVEPSDLPIK
jgi:hypothetical protein